MKKKRIGKKIIFAAPLAIILCVVLVVFAVRGSGTEDVQVTYRETKVQRGNLVVGVSESGAVDIGTVEQTFDLDMSALQRVSTTTSSGSAGGGFGGTASGTGSFGNAGMGGFGSGSTGGFGGTASGGTGMNSGGGLGMFDQIFDMAGGSSSFTQSGSSLSLEIANVLVSVGQHITVGDALIELREESVTELTEELQANIEKAKADLDAVYAAQELSGQTAENTYKSSIAYGEYAQTEYENTISSLEAAVKDKEDALAEAEALLASYREQLLTLEQMHQSALKVVENCQWSFDHADKYNELYQYVTAYETLQSAQTAAENLAQKVETMKQNIEQGESNVRTAEKNFSTAKRSLESGKITARETYELRLLAYETAEETYNIALAYLADDALEQEETYAETLEKWDEYSTHIDGVTIRSKYDGVITGVDLVAGDSVSTGTVLVTLYNMEAVSMTVTLYEEDMTNIALGSEASITFIAYPDSPFRAQITEISEASTDSSGNVTYDVTATLQGDVSGLFQGMTGEITFISSEAADVLFVSKRAVFTEGNKSYVKMYDGNGNVVQVQVETGFSDGTYVEIVSGVSEGDIVLIESKVGK